MTRRWVVNASPLIVLGKVGQLALLQELSDELVVPDAVAIEIGAGETSDNAQRWITKEGNRYIHIVDKIDPVVAGWDLGAGESSVLAFARLHSGYESIIDDRAARNCASITDSCARDTGHRIIGKTNGGTCQSKADSTRTAKIRTAC